MKQMPIKQARDIAANVLGGWKYETHSQRMRAMARLLRSYETSGNESDGTAANALWYGR